MKNPQQLAQHGVRPWPPRMCFGSFPLLACVSFLFSVGIGGAAPKRLAVVAATSDQAAIAREVGGARVEVSSLARPTEDPHFVDPKPSLIVKLRDADVLIEGGAELEAGWLPPLLERARNPKLAPGNPGRVIAREGIQMLEVPATLDRSKGDLHAAGNPHFLVDPVNAKILAQHLAARYSSLDPSSAATYKENFGKFSARLDAKLKEWQQTLAPFAGQTVVGYHNSWPYFGRRFGLRIDLFLEPKPGLPPTPAHLAEVMRQMSERKARVIIVDHYLDRRTAETVAARTGAGVIEVSHFPGGVKGTEGGYFDLLDYLVNSIAAALGNQR